MEREDGDHQEKKERAQEKERERENKRRRGRERGGGEASSHLRVYCWSGQLKKKTIFVKIESDSCHHHKRCAETFSSDGNKSLIIRRERERESLCVFERESK